jgi:hypothetical protein
VSDAAVALREKAPPGGQAGRLSWAQSPLGLRPRDQIRVKPSPSSSSWSRHPSTLPPSGRTRAEVKGGLAAVLISTRVARVAVDVRCSMFDVEPHRGRQVAAIRGRERADLIP